MVSESSDERNLQLHDSSTIKFRYPDVMGSFAGRGISAQTHNDSMNGVYSIRPALVNMYQTV
jgi:hypothetical protein